jgi:serine/threonine protein kinase/Tfp pilus assembly protein PilF
MGVECPKCKTENTSDSEFCKKCATPLPSSEEITASPTKTLETPTEELTTGSTFARRYQIIEELGKGGMGKVYKALDTEIKEKIALKLINPEISADKRTIERFQNELKFARKISHRNVCRMYDLNKEEGSYYITMEYVSGEDLKSMIGMMGQLSGGKAISVARQVCEGLTEAHRLGVVHRDLKPQNIMIDKEGNARIMDFGIARSLKAKGITGAGVMIGTPEYMSPEQAEVKEIDQRSDIYSLGIILYEMVTGRVPFEGETPLGIAMKHKSEEPKDPREFNSQIPEDLSQVILRCMEKDKEKRYQSAGEVRSELSAIEKGIPTTERIKPKRKPITSKEITVTFGLKKILIPASIVISIVVIGLISWLLFFQKEAISPSPDKHSIAVLPFVDLSAQKDQEYFCDGLAEELINRLTNIENLRVPARASAFSFKGKGLDIREIGEKLNVEMVLDGSVRKSGNKLRITAELVKAADGYPVWSKIYESNIEDTFALQDKISLAIVDSLQIKLLGKDKAKLVKRHTRNLEAYNLYLMGRFFWNKRTGEDMRKSVQYFEQAIEKDPTYALALAGLADSYITLGQWEFLPSKEAYPKAKEAAIKALELDDLLAEAHNSLATVKSDFDWDWEGAEKEYKRAITLNPNYATAHQWYAEHLMKMLRFEDALTEFDRALEIDPLSLIINAVRGWPFVYAHEYDKAIEQYKKTLEMDPDFGPARGYLAYAYKLKGMYEEALKEYKLLNSRKGMATTYAKIGNTKEVHRLLNELIEQSKHTYVSPFSFARVYFEIRDNDQGFAWLERAYEERDYLISRIKILPEFDNVRSDPRFTLLLKKMGLD